MSTLVQINGNNNVLSGNTLVGQLNGVTVVGSNNTIGGTTAAARNVISGDETGVKISGGCQFLLRPPDPRGLNGWVNLPAHGVRDETVIADILGSPEYFNNPIP